MEDNETMVLVVVIIAFTICVISVLIFYEDYVETELEICMGKCDDLIGEEDESECMLQCINHFSNYSLMEEEK